MRSAKYLLAILLFSVGWSFGQTREQTTIQSKRASLKGKDNVLTVKYLNFPWGAKTFEQIERGADNYYGARSWPFARIIIQAKFIFAFKELPPGNYALVLNPAKLTSPASLSVIKLKADEEFLQSGKVFEEAPDGEILFTTKLDFTRLESVKASHLTLDLLPDEAGCKMILLYGNRKCEFTFILVQ